MSARQRFVSTWIAILAILLNALMPTVSMAFVPTPTANSAAGGGWVEMCTSQGSSWVLLGADGQLLAQTNQRPNGAPAAAHHGHCPYCLTHAASFGLPPAPAAALLPVPDVADRWSAAKRQVWTRWDWLAPAVRAPPGCV